ncbi:MAG: cytosine deaminase, partial [Achromobacter spanius]
MTDLLLKNVRIVANHAAEAVDVLVRGGRILQIQPGIQAPADMLVEDGGGALLLPGLVEGHTHLDKTNWDSPWYVNAVGP